MSKAKRFLAGFAQSLAAMNREDELARRDEERFRARAEFQMQLARKYERSTRIEEDENGKPVIAVYDGEGELISKRQATPAEAREYGVGKRKAEVELEDMSPDRRAQLERERQEDRALDREYKRGSLAAMGASRRAADRSSYEYAATQAADKFSKAFLMSQIGKEPDAGVAPEAWQSWAQRKSETELELLAAANEVANELQTTDPSKVYTKLAELFGTGRTPPTSPSGPQQMPYAPMLEKYRPKKP